MNNCTIVDGLGQLPVAGTMAVIVNKEEEGQGAGVSEVILIFLKGKSQEMEIF